MPPKCQQKQKKLAKEEPKRKLNFIANSQIFQIINRFFSFYIEIESPPAKQT